MRNQLIYPMALYVFYIFGLAIYNFKIRFSAIKTGQISHKYFKAFTGEPPPERVAVVGRHYDNQFQLPILYLITCSFFSTNRHVSLYILCLAWFFVISRFVHSFIHLGPNKLKYRSLTFALGWLAVILMWGHLIYYSL